MASDSKNSQFYNSICEDNMDLSGDNWDEVLSQVNNEILTFIIYNTDRYFCISRKTLITSILTDYYNIANDLNNIIQSAGYVKFPFTGIRINKNIIQHIEDGYSLFYLYPSNNNNNIYLSIPFNKNVLYENNIRTIREMANELIGQYEEMPDINVNNLNYFRLVYDELRLNADPFYAEQKVIDDEKSVLSHIEDIELRNQAEQQLIERQNALNMRRRDVRRVENMDNILSPEELQRQRDEARQRARQQLIENNPELQISQEERDARFREREREIEEKEYINQEIEEIEEIEYVNQEVVEEDTIDYMFIDASINGRLEDVRTLLDRGVDIHYNDDFAFRWASCRGHLEVVRLLLDRGADIHADDDGALYSASETGHLEVVRLLLDRGADIHAVDDYALSVASYNGHLEVVRLLLNRGATINDEALLLSFYNNNINLVELLLNNGAIINRDIINILHNLQRLENGNYRYENDEFSPELIELMRNAYEEQQRNRRNRRNR